MKCFLLLLPICLSIAASAQNVGIGTSTPKARLHVADSSVLFSAPDDVPANSGAPPISGPGRRMMWYPDKSAFRAGTVINEWNKDSIGLYSAALGVFNLALGNYSFSMGFGNRAVGNGSVALGTDNNALAPNSAAIGYNNKTKGLYAAALGVNTQANAYASMAVGMYNDTLVAQESLPGANSPVFVVGNGTAANSRNKAMAVLRNGNVGIGTGTPAARLHVLDSSVLFSGSFGLPVNPGLPPASGQGKRMMWYPDKAAFRIGGAFGTEWDRENIGVYSVAMGVLTKASGQHSFASGNQSTATAEGATAIGRHNDATGPFSVAMGTHSIASAHAAIAIGQVARATGIASVALGYDTKANGIASTAIGFSNTANGFASLVAGLYNDTIVTTANISATTPLFILGNGDNNDTRSNAMVVRKDGRVGLSTNNPLSTLHVKQLNSAGGIMLENVTDGNKWRLYSASGDNNLTFYNNDNVEIADIDDVTGIYSALSDSRFKKNIETLTPVLPSLLQLKPSYYHFNWQADADEKQIGMLAQHSYSLFPQLVSYDKEKDVYKMNYAGFSTVAIKAIQEQQLLIEQQQQLIDTLIKRLEKLEAKTAQPQ